MSPGGFGPFDKIPGSWHRQQVYISVCIYVYTILVLSQNGLYRERDTIVGAKNKGGRIVVRRLLNPISLLKQRNSKCSLKSCFYLSCSSFL